MENKWMFMNINLRKANNIFNYRLLLVSNVEVFYEELQVIHWEFIGINTKPKFKLLKILF